MAALVDQSLPHDEYEIIIVDNGSGDLTWDTLREFARSSPARLAVTMLPQNRGPGGGRNHGFTFVRAPYVAITDDDCLPTPGWLAAMLASLEQGCAVTQGQVHADPSDRDTAGPWNHTKWITSPTPFFETCNVAYRISAVTAVGGFDETDPLTAQVSGRAFGEDALLAWRVQEAGGQATFAKDSLVYHRNIPADFGDWLDGQRNLVGFAGLGNQQPACGAVVLAPLLPGARNRIVRPGGGQPGCRRGDASTLGGRRCPAMGAPTMARCQTPSRGQPKPWRGAAGSVGGG